MLEGVAICVRLEPAAKTSRARTPAPAPHWGQSRGIPPFLGMSPAARVDPCRAIHLFEGASEATVGEAARRSEFAAHRIVDAIG